MYIYLENNFFIPLTEIIAVVNKEKFENSSMGKDYIEKNRTNIINVSKDEPKSIVITDEFIYFTSYTCRAIYCRGNEFENMKCS